MSYSHTSSPLVRRPRVAPAQELKKAKGSGGLQAAGGMEPAPATSRIEAAERAGQQAGFDCSH